MRLLPGAGGPCGPLNNFLGPDNAALRRQISIANAGANAWITRRTVFDDLKHTFGTRRSQHPHNPNHPLPPFAVSRIARPRPAQPPHHRTNRFPLGANGSLGKLGGLCAGHPIPARPLSTNALRAHPPPSRTGEVGGQSRQAWVSLPASASCS
jgi:hypothetical protein